MGANVNSVKLGILFMPLFVEEVGTAFAAWQSRLMTIVQGDPSINVIRLHSA